MVRIEIVVVEVKDVMTVLDTKMTVDQAKTPAMTAAFSNFCFWRNSGITYDFIQFIRQFMCINALLPDTRACSL
jgi:hypothetical protein